MNRNYMPPVTASSRIACEQIMSHCLAESPTHWPHGLSFGSFSPSNGESVYLVREKSAGAPIGFVGWQSRREGGRRVGYYSVGLMPEHRGRGYAKEAVRKLIAMKSASVDEVKALVHPTNAPSIGLAQALGVLVVKSAASKFPELAKRFFPALRDSPVAKAVTRAAIGAGAGAAATAGLNKATGADEWANPQTQRAQYMTTGLLGALAAQKGAPGAARRFLMPKRQIGGPSIASKLLGVEPTPASTIREFSPRRALSLASAPGVAYGTPLAIGSAHKPLSQGFADLTKEYEADFDRTGKDQGSMFDYITKRIGNHVGEKLQPTVQQLGNRAIDSAKEIAPQAVRDMGSTMWGDVKPHLGTFAKEVAKPLAASTAGAGLGYMAGNMVQNDDPSLPYEERVARRDRQKKIKNLLAMLGGAGGYALQQKLS